MVKSKPSNSGVTRLRPIPVEMIERRIFLIRGQKVMLDEDLAALYRVETRVLLQAVKRNSNRFPEDFMFQLSKQEQDCLRSQIVISNNSGRGGRRYLPYAFTEHGVAMLSSVLNSQHAIQMNILIIRAFIKLREMLSTHKALAIKIEEREYQQKKYGQQLATVYSMVKKMIETPAKPQNQIGFKIKEG
ncbi:MAG: ORF6N domain-containing protein [Acidobacteria bacterium]|nr:ORF6N domain-containing protein [Acidobacteriota bacterium]